VSLREEPLAPEEEEEGDRVPDEDEEDEDALSEEEALRLIGEADEEPDASDG